jgi:hypothetical protein
MGPSWTSQPTWRASARGSTCSAKMRGEHPPPPHPQLPCRHSHPLVTQEQSLTVARSPPPSLPHVPAHAAASRCPVPPPPPMPRASPHPLRAHPPPPVPLIGLPLLGTQPQACQVVILSTPRCGEEVLRKELPSHHCKFQRACCTFCKTSLLQGACSVSVYSQTSPFCLKISTRFMNLVQHVPPSRCLGLVRLTNLVPHKPHKPHQSPSQRPVSLYRRVVGLGFRAEGTDA